LAVLALVIAVSVAIFADARHLKFLDALELVLGVVSSTGLGWVADSSEPGWLTLYTIGLMIVGTVAVTVLYAFITNYIVSVKLSGLLGQQPVTLRDHVVVCGLGTVGYRVAKGLLDQGEQVAVLERDAGNRFVPLIRAERHARVVIADARLPASMALANIGAARCIVAATSDDMANIQTALLAREQHPDLRVVLRAFDHDTAQQVAETFGLSLALSASAVAAPTFVAAAAGRAIVHQVQVGGQRLRVARLTVPPGRGGAIGALLEGLTAGVLYHLPATGQPQYRPAAGTLLAPGDAVVVAATDVALATVAARLGPGGPEVARPAAVGYSSTTA
ncbi:MAG TPA: NAD-binding protein, partial [Chloroflexia bacterium]|nr:NAD-binding protein [Chloroflexia bacterium]